MIPIIKKIVPLKYKYSRKRERILEILRGTGTHPTASWVYDQLKDEFPNLSLGTVYRNLSILADQGLIHEINFGSTFDRYDANISHHYHFICENCGSIIDLPVPIREELNEELTGDARFRAKRHDIQLYGLCSTCNRER